MPIRLPSRMTASVGIERTANRAASSGCSSTLTFANRYCGRRRGALDLRRHRAAWRAPGRPEVHDGQPLANLLIEHICRQILNHRCAGACSRGCVVAHGDHLSWVGETRPRLWLARRWRSKSIASNDLSRRSAGSMRRGRQGPRLRSYARCRGLGSCELTTQVTRRFEASATSSLQTIVQL